MSEATAPLARLVEDVKRASAKVDRGAAVSAWMLDRESVRVAATATPDEVEAYLTALEAVPGMGPAAGRVRRCIAGARRSGGGTALRVAGHADEWPALDVEGQRVELPPGYHMGPGGELLRDQGGEAPEGSQQVLTLAARAAVRERA